MHSQQHKTEPDDTLAARLSLKRRFLLSLVISLTACAATAIAALLLSTFNQTTARILGTLLALAFHSGIAMACAASLERRRWPTLNIVALILFSLNFAVLLICIWWPAIRTDDYAIRAILTTLTLLGAYLFAIPCTAIAQTQRWKPLPLLGLGACAAAFLMVLVCIWSNGDVTETFAKATWIAAVVTFSFSHLCLIGMVPALPSLRWLLALAVASLWTMAAVAISIILATPAGEHIVRLAGAVGVLDAAASLALLIMTKAKQVENIQQLQSTPARLKIHCPRCETPQVVEAGPSKCHACGLKFRIHIEEPRCAKCGYLLWQLPQRRCPECGTTF